MQFPIFNLQSANLRRWCSAAATVLLVIHSALAIDTLRRKSVTVDEVGHLPAGVSYWQKGTFELYHHNPPLVKLLAALPAMAAGPTVDYSKSWETNRQRGMPLSPWAFGWEFMYANAARYHDIFFWARLPVVALSLLAGVVIFWWARELFGPGAAVVGLTLWTFCPNVLAHAGLVTTDMGATSLGFVATYFFWRYLRQPTHLRAGVAGLVLGLAELTKFSLLILYLLWPALWLAWFVLSRRRAGGEGKADGGSRQAPTRRKRNAASPGKATGQSDRGQLSESAANASSVRLGVVHGVVLLAVSVLVINLGYLFEGSGTRLGEFPFMSRSLTRPREAGTQPPPVPPDHPWRAVVLQRQNRFAGTWLAHLPVPLPRQYLEGFDEQKLESEGIEGQGYPVYLRGELRRTGWWWYYFYALAVKVPLGTWLLTLAAAATVIVRPSARASLRDEIVLLAPVVVVLIVMSFLTDINLGLRYVLPIFPFWFVLLSRVATWIEPRRVAVTAAIVLPLAWNVACCVRVHPDHLAYFNELVGGPEQGYRHLIDSNLDWGQDLLALESWLRENRPGERIGLAYFGNVDPSILAASGRPLDFELAPPGRLDNLRLVATKPGEAFYQLRNRWVQRHVDELQSWLITQHTRGLAAQPNDHPALRLLAIEHIGLREGPQPGLFAISANFVAGLPFRLRDHAGNIWHAEQDAYAYYRQLTPIGQVGYSIFIYDVTTPQAVGLREKIGLPWPEARDQTIE